MKKHLSAKSILKKGLNGLMLALIFSGFIREAKAQTVLVGNNTGTSLYYPLYNYYGYNYSQSIYLASELNSGGASGPSYISAIRYFYASDGSPASNWNQWTVYMANTAQSSFASNTAWIPGLTQVFSGTINVPATSGQWMTIQLATPFLWDGTSNIVVGIDENSPGYASPYSQWRSTTLSLPDLRSLLYYNDNINPSPSSPPAANQSDNIIPDIQFVMYSSTPCSGAPSTATATASYTNVCTNTPIDLDLTNFTPTSGESYQWQSSPNGSTWTNMGSPQTSSYYTVSSQTATTYYRCVVTCTSSAQSTSSAPVLVNSNPPINCYCMPNNPSYVSDCTNDRFVNFSVANVLSQGSNCDSYGFSDSTGSHYTTINLNAGQTYTLTVNTQISQNTGNGAQGAWIDFDQNRSFDSNEFINLGYGATGTYTASFTVPLGSPAGAVRMRLKLDVWYAYSGTSIDACSNNGNSGNIGQVIDYKVNVAAAPACSGNPAAGNAVSTVSTTCSNNPFTLDLANAGIALGLKYQWQSSPNGTAWTALGTLQNSSSYTISSQNTTTYYRCVVTCTNSSLTATSTPVTVSQNAFTSCYCTPQPLICGGGDGFSSVTFLNINDNPVCNANGYIDNTAAVPAASVTAGQSYTISTSNGTSTYNSDYMGAWIDYDHSGTFDAAEFTLIGNGTNTTVTGSLSVPFTALGGLTVMRLRSESSYNASFQPLSPCVGTTSSYGETIDYAVYITPSPACSGLPVAGNAISTSTAVCPNVSYTLDLAGTGQVSGNLYQWQSSPNGTTWTNLGAPQTTVPYSVASQTAATYYRCVVTCTNSSQSSNSGTVSVIQNPPTACYCVPASYNCGNESIGNFVFQSINDSPVCPSSQNGYIDQTGAILPPTISANQTYTTMLAVTTNSPGLQNIAGLWLDYDANGIFDASEYTFFGSGTGSTYTASISVPFTAAGGSTRMRVALDAGFSSISTQDPCNASSSFGMAIDYLVNITPVTACSAAVNAGTTTVNSASICPNTDLKLDLAGNSIASGISYQWQSSPNGISWSNLGSAQSTVPYEVFTQTVTTHYRCVLTCTAAASTATSMPVTVSINSPTVCYCVNPATDCSSDQIINVILANLTNTSTCSASGYSDYTSTVPSATVAAGQSYTLTTETNGSYNEYVSVWIDFDHNGVFDPSEYTFIGSSNGTNDTIKNTITIPVNALTGDVRMRVRTYNYSQLLDVDACNNPNNAARLAQASLVQTSYGETEDYLLTITPPNCSQVALNSGMPVTGPSTVCASSSMTLDLATPVQQATGLTYQWQFSASGSSYTDIGSPIATSSVVISPPQTGYYHCVILCNASPAATSGTVFVTAVSPNVTASASPSVICSAETSTLTAAGAVSYTWGIGATAPTTTVNPTAGSTTVATTYFVNGADANGCVGTGSVSVLVKPSTAISGTVSTNPGNVAGIVILYKYEPFLVKFDSTDYTTIQANGTYNFPSVSSTTYIVKAVPSASSLQITYSPNVISWQTATPLTHSCVVNSITNIQVQPYTTLAVGTGSLSGKIREGIGYVHKGLGQKPEAPGNPIPGVVVKGGKNPGAAIFAQTTTDANGNYAFSNLPINASNEDYFILVDIPGLDTNGTYHKQITAMVNSYDSLNFVVDNQYVNPVQNNATSINTLHIADNNIRVFPNPASSGFTISYSLLRQSNVRIELLDVVGKTVKHIQPNVSQATGDYAQPVTIDQIGQGMYFVKIFVDGDEATIKLCITN